MFSRFMVYKAYIDAAIQQWPIAVAPSMPLVVVFRWFLKESFVNSTPSLPLLKDNEEITQEEVLLAPDLELLESERQQQKEREKETILEEQGKAQEKSAENKEEIKEEEVQQEEEEPPLSPHIDPHKASASPPVVSPSASTDGTKQRRVRKKKKTDPQFKRHSLAPDLELLESERQQQKEREKLKHRRLMKETILEEQGKAQEKSAENKEAIKEEDVQQEEEEPPLSPHINPHKASASPPVEYRISDSHDSDSDIASLPPSDSLAAGEARTHSSSNRTDVKGPSEELESSQPSVSLVGGMVLKESSEELSESMHLLSSAESLSSCFTEMTPVRETLESKVPEHVEALALSAVVRTEFHSAEFSLSLRGATHGHEPFRAGSGQSYDSYDPADDTDAGGYISDIDFDSDP